MPQTLQQALPIAYFACTWERSRDEVQRQRACDWWIFGWPALDFDWVLGYGKAGQTPLTDHSPLARSYYEQLSAAIQAEIAQTLSQCEQRHQAAQTDPKPGLRLSVASRLAQGRAVSASDKHPRRVQTRLTVPFAPNSTPPPAACPLLRRELFSEPVEFGYTVYGPGDGNFRWEWRDRQAPQLDPTFELYGRTLRFSGAVLPQFLGQLHLLADRVADLWVRFEPRPLPPEVMARVDPAQPLSYELSPGSGYFGIAAVIELWHLDSGQIGFMSIHGADHAPGQLSAPGAWPGGWDVMAMDAQGLIRHHGADLPFALWTLDPAALGLPTTGRYRLRYLLLAHGYQTGPRWVRSSALGQNADTRMSWKPLSLSHMPGLSTYTPGLTQGAIEPFEIEFVRSPVLADAIEFDAVFDFKHLSTFRFVVKLVNHLDFAVGLVVQASGWQAWVRLEPGQTRHLAGAVSVSGMGNGNAYPLHPQSPHYGWGRNWSSSYIAMANGQCSVPFLVFLTAPSSPESTPANLPALRATQRWTWDLANWGPQHAPLWAAIKKYGPDGRYDYEAVLQPSQPDALAITRLTRSITLPLHQPLIDPASYFVSGEGTSAYDWVSPWHKRPWPGYSGWGALSMPIMVNAEQRSWDGVQEVWLPVQALSLSLSRAMLQQVAALLGVAEAVQMDGDDLRWFQISASGAWHNLLWIDRFYRPDGQVIDDAAMRAAFEAVIQAHATADPPAWPNLRAIVVHPEVRFGSFLDNGGFEVGDYRPGPEGNFVEVTGGLGLAALSSLSTRFAYRIRPEFR